MLQIIVPACEAWDEKNEVFINYKEQKLMLEHSLVSISKWESKWCKPFMTKAPKTFEETIDYIRCMTITQNVPEDTYLRLTRENFKEINDYIGAPMSASTVKHLNKGNKTGEQVTSELVYYWMSAYNIPMECQKWHFNRLIKLIEVTDAKNQPSKKMSSRQVMSQNAALNAARRKKMHSKG